jgi:hypothetical protein
MDFINNHGSLITDEDLESWSDEVSSGDMSAWDTDVATGCGNLIPKKVEKENISFSVTSSMKERIKRYAKKNNCTTSDYIRAAISEKMLAETA